MTLKHRLVQVYLLLIIIVLLATLGFALLGISYCLPPFELVKAQIDPFAIDGSADAFAVALLEQIVVRLRFVGIALLLVSGLLYVGRRQAQQHVSTMLTSLFHFLRELAQHFKEAVRKEDKTHLSAFLMILLLAIAVRLFFLFQPIRSDEAYTFMVYASRPLYFGLSAYSPNNHLFHTLLVHVAYLLLGNRPWVIRLPALVAGILLVPASYMVTRILYNKHAALLTAGFVASSSALILYSTNARGYTLICLIFLLILALGAYLTQSRNSAAWLLFAVLSALGFYTSPIMLYPFGIVVIWLFLSIIFQNTNLSRSLLLKDLFISLIIAALLILMLYAPVVVISGLKSVVANRFVVSISWSDFVALWPPSLGSVWNLWNIDIPTGISFLLVIGFFTSLVFHRRLTGYGVPIILAVVIWLVLILLVQRVVPYSRVWLFLLPLYITLASSGVSYLLKPVESKISHHKSAILAILAITLSFWLSLNGIHRQSVYYSNEGGTSKDAEAITVFLKDYVNPGDRVLAVGSAGPPLKYYFNLYDIPGEYLSSDLKASHRILIIVNEPGQILEELLDKEGLSAANYSVPRLIQRYKFASLYEMNGMNDRKER